MEQAVLKEEMLASHVATLARVVQAMAKSMQTGHLLDIRDEMDREDIGLFAQPMSVK